MRAARVDANHSQIVAELRKAGVSVFSLHAVGDGCGDIICGIRRRTYLFEIKTDEGELTPAQIKFRDEWRGQYDVIRTAEDALRVMGLI